MARTRTQQSGYSRNRTGSKNKTSASKSEFGRMPIRQAVFQLSPTALRAQLEVDEYEEDPQVEDSDIEDRDDDELPLDEDENERHINQYTARLLEPIEFTESATLALKNIYPITISGESGCSTSCRFEGPSWFYGVLPADASEYVEKLTMFLSAVGDWFEENKQTFLQMPTPENYVFNETDFSVNPVVIQEGLLARINERLSQNHRLTKSDLSRLLNKVWLLWPEWNMPLRHIFSKGYQLEWVVRGCLVQHEQKGVWLEELSNDFSNKELMAAKRKDFGNLTMEERFRVLCAAVSVKPEDVFRAVRMQLKNK